MEAVAKKVDLSKITSHPLVQQQHQHQQQEPQTPQTPSTSQSPVDSLRMNRRRGKLTPIESDGLYNSELPSPKPNVLLPNFSISSYAESRKLSFIR